MLNVPLKKDSVWLNHNQMAELFDRNVMTVGRHVNNAIREKLAGLPLLQNLRQLPPSSKNYINYRPNLQIVGEIIDN